MLQKCRECLETTFISILILIENITLLQSKLNYVHVMLLEYGNHYNETIIRKSL